MLSPRNDREASFMIPQQYGHFMTAIWLNDDNTDRHANSKVGNLTERHPRTKNYRQLRDAESRRNSLFQV